MNYEDLLRHGAEHPVGIFSNKSYRQGVIDWATGFVRKRPLVSKSLMRDLSYTVDVPDALKKEQFDKQHEEYSNKTDEIQRLLAIVENQ